MKKIIRVFPEKNSFTPSDDYALIGLPPFDDMIPAHDEVHISCTFTWDREYCLKLQEEWQARTKRPVLIGGVGFGSRADEFVQGRYVAQNITFTSRGCNNNCAFCIVPKLEGRIKELPICAGNVIQDNNFLQCNRDHKNKVFDMLKKQTQICFKGGLQPDLIDDHFISGIQGLRIKELWTACDSKGSENRFLKGCEKLRRAGFRQDQIRCYVLIGDDMEENEGRLRMVFEAGALPFAQLRMDFGDNKTEYTKEWHQFQRKWSRPAAYKSYLKDRGKR